MSNGNIEFRVESDGQALRLTSELITADHIREIIQNGYITDVPAEWEPSDRALGRILDGMSEDLEASPSITEALVNDVAESIRFVVPIVYGDEQEEGR